MKKKLAIVLAACLLLAVLPLSPVGAAERDTAMVGEMEFPSGGLFNPEPICLGLDEEYGEEVSVSAAEYDRNAAAECLREGAAAHEESIDFLAMNVPKDEFANVTFYFYNRYADMYHVGGFTYYCNSSNIVTQVFPKYTMTAEEYTESKAEFDELMDDILEQVEDSFTPMQKVLFLHDYIASQFEYDLEGLELENQKLGRAIYDSYNFLKMGKGVCQAYTLTIEWLLDELEIPVSFVQSTYLNHIWNSVQVGGQWYQMDVTHDDPVVDRLGAVEHQEFLISEEKMMRLKNVAKGITLEDYKAGLTNGVIPYDWRYGDEVTCSDKSYESWFWQDVSSPIIYEKKTGNWYCMRSRDSAVSGLHRWDGVNNSSVRLQSVSSLSGWKDGQGNSSAFAAGLALYRGILYFTAPDGVYQYELSTGTQTQLFSVTNFRTVDRVYGLRVDGYTLKYDYRAFDSLTGNWDKEIRTITLDRYYRVDGLFGWYYADDTVWIELPETPACTVMVAWYEGPKMKKMESFAAAGEFCSYGPADGVVKIFALDSNWAPKCEPVLQPE